MLSIQNYVDEHIRAEPSMGRSSFRGAMKETMKGTMKGTVKGILRKTNSIREKDSKPKLTYSKVIFFFSSTLLIKEKWLKNF